MENKQATYERMREYLNSIYGVSLVASGNADKQQNKKLKMISMLICNYAKKMAKINNIALLINHDKPVIDMTCVFEYITFNSIELLDFSTVDESDIDVNKESDLERFILSHVYYLTQQT